MASPWSGTLSGCNFEWQRVRGVRVLCAGWIWLGARTPGYPLRHLRCHFVTSNLQCAALRRLRRLPGAATAGCRRASRQDGRAPYVSPTHSPVIEHRHHVHDGQQEQRDGEGDVYIEPRLEDVLVPLLKDEPDQ